VIVVYALGVLAPLLGAVTYRRAGLSRRGAAGFAILATALTAAAGLAGVLYVYAIAIDAGLCGSSPVAADVAGVVAWIVVASWAALRPRRFWAWPVGLLAGLAVWILVSYFVGPHVYCET